MSKLENTIITLELNEEQIKGLLNSLVESDNEKLLRYFINEIDFETIIELHNNTKALSSSEFINDYIINNFDIGTLFDLFEYESLSDYIEYDNIVDALNKQRYDLEDTILEICKELRNFKTEVFIKEFISNNYDSMELLLSIINDNNDIKEEFIKKLLEENDLIQDIYKTNKQVVNNEKIDYDEKLSKLDERYNKTINVLMHQIDILNSEYTKLKNNMINNVFDEKMNDINNIKLEQQNNQIKENIEIV